MAEFLDRRKDPEKVRMVITAGSWVTGVLVIAIALALFAIRDVILIILTAIVIASAIEPAAVWAKKHRIPRLPAVLGVYIFLALTLAGLFYFLFLPLLDEASSFIAAFPQYSKTILSGPGFSSGILSSIKNTISPDDIANYLNGVVGTLSHGAFISASVFFGGAISFILIVVLSFYLAVQEDGVGKFLKVITPWKQEKYIVNLWRRSKLKIGLWMQGQLLLGVIIMVLVYLGLLLIGIDHALLLAVMAGLFEIIPLFGPIIAAIPAVLIAFGQGGMSLGLIVAGLFLITQQFENHLIYPLVVKKVIGIPPMVSILALLIGGELAGFLGILISVPVATVIMEFLTDLEERKVAQKSEISKAIS
jgi:predicted PurR-regulated permease PerM